MTNYTTKETSLKLHELTGWETEDKSWYYKDDDQKLDNTCEYSVYSTDFLLSKIQISLTNFLLSKMPLSLTIENGLQGFEMFARGINMPTFIDRNPAEALAKLLIWMIENKYMEIEKQKAVSENEKIREMLNDPEVIGKAAKGAIKAQRKMAGLEN